MKSSFLLTVVLGALITNISWGQTKTTTVTDPAQTEEKSSFDKFWARVKIGYFGVFTSPNLDQMEKGNWRNGAISPRWGNAPKGNQKNNDTWPASMWNQVAFRYNYGGKMDFVIAPRFVVPLAHSVDMKAPEERSLIYLDDLLVGVQGVPFSSEDKKFNFWMRPGVRLPTSAPSRNSGNRGFGQLSHQLELAFNPTYDFNKTWQVGYFGQLRQWIYENRYNWSRFRVISSPYVQYTVSDTFRWLAYYQNILENDRRWKTINNKKPVFKDYDQEIYAGPSIDITKKLNVFPYLSVFVDDIPITDKSFYIGAWISYAIK